MSTPHKCPVCDRTGKLQRPPWVEGDAPGWFSSGIGQTYDCVPCKGTGIVWEPGWRPIETAPECESVLVIHIDDLYPTVAFRVFEEATGKSIWFRETEGPEDTNDGRPHKHTELYRPPTHWRYLDQPPIKEEPK